MVDYMTLKSKKDDFLLEYRIAFREAEENSPTINLAALNIQRTYRGVVDREKISKKNFAAGEIQRIFRGLSGRMVAANVLNQKLDSRQVSLFHYLCIQIQKCFRGYYSRKYKHDQKRRKEYAQMLVERGEQIREQMNRYREEVATREEEENKQRSEQEFKNLAANLHHLTSTRQVPGVYNPRQDCIQMPTMRGLPVEEHIRGVVKDLLRTRGIAHKGLEEDIYGTKRVPLKGLKYRLSIQASTPYDTIEQEKRRQRMLHRILTRDKGDWFAGGNPKLLEPKDVPLSVGDVYMDPWANPMLVKGVPESQQQLLDSAYSHKALFATQNSRRLQQPYYTRVGGNKSTALANDVFDTMAEAQQTGGAAQRHLGITKTSRFGLPESADSRYDGVMPSPPLRTTRDMKTSRSMKSKTLQQYVESKSKTTRSTNKHRSAAAASSNSSNGKGKSAMRSMASMFGEEGIDGVDSEVLAGGNDVATFGPQHELLLFPEDADSSDDDVVQPLR